MTMPRAKSSTSRGGRSRAAILKAAVSLFARFGYRGAPLAAVADAAQMTQPGLLHHFPSKQHLLLAVLEDRDLDAKRRAHGGFNAGGHTTLNALRDLVEYNATTPELVQLFTVLVGEGVSADHPAHTYFTDRYAGLRHQLTRALQLGQETGDFRADVDVSLVASLILAMMDGLQIQWLLDHDQEMPPRFALFLDILIQYLAAPSKHTRSPSAARVELVVEGDGGVDQ
jgi:AcrR family transcriptional regulator